MSISSIGNIGTQNIGYTSPLDATSIDSTQDPDGDGDSGTSSVARRKDQFRGDFASMLDAIKAGDMTAAQSALSTLQSDLQTSSYGPSSSSSPATSSATSSRQNDLDTLFQAVKSGDLSGAQSALANLQSDVQTNQAAPASQQAPRAHGHHHHHHGGGGGMTSALESALASIDSSSSTTNTSTTTNTTSPSSATSSSNDTSAV